MMGLNIKIRVTHVLAGVPRHIVVTFTDGKHAKGVIGEEGKFLVLLVGFKVPVEGERGRKHHFI